MIFWSFWLRNDTTTHQREICDMSPFHAFHCVIVGGRRLSRNYSVHHWIDDLVAHRKKPQQDAYEEVVI